MMAGSAVSSCDRPLASRSERTAGCFRSDASRRCTATSRHKHRRRGYLGHEIVDPSGEIVVRVSGDYVRIRHVLHSTGQDIYTEPFHGHDTSGTEGIRATEDRAYA